MAITPVPDEEGASQTAPPASGGETPEQLLERLKKELEQKDSSVGSLTKQRDNLKAQVETLSRTVEDIRKAASGYGQARPGLDEARAKLFAHYEAEVVGVEANLGTKAEKVREAVGKVDADIKKQKETVVPEAEKRAATAAGEADAAKAKAEQEQKEYDALKNLHKTLGDNIKKLKDLEDKAEAFDRQTKPASEYVILLEQKTVFGQTRVPTPEEYAKQLNEAGQELDAARVAERDKKQAAEAAAADLKKEQAALKALEDKRVADILTAVENLN